MSFAELSRMATEAAIERDGPGGTWQRICVCGHIEKVHSDKIGGTMPGWVEKRDKKTKIEVLSVDGCTGPPRNKGTDSLLFSTKDNPDGLPYMISTKHTTCPCPKFTPIAEALNPRFRFNQKLPVKRGVGGRDRDPMRHPFMAGVRATRTSVTNLRKVQAKRDKMTERQFQEFIDRMVEERVRWLDGAQVCAHKGCGRKGDGILPVFVDANDLSELRCADHRA